MSKKDFLLSVIRDLSNKEENEVNWRGTLSSWIKC